MNTESRGTSLGRGFLSGGYVLLGVGVGVGVTFGYWASDWGTRFSPSVVGGMFLLWACGFVLFALGAQLLRGGLEPGVANRKLGRRAAVFATLATSAIWTEVFWESWRSSNHTLTCFMANNGER